MLWAEMFALRRHSVVFGRVARFFVLWSEACAHGDRPLHKPSAHLSFDRSFKMCSTFYKSTIWNTNSLISTPHGPRQTRSHLASCARPVTQPCAGCQG